MKYKQICPECYEEVVLENKSDAKKRCPSCKGTAIWGKKLIAIEKIDDPSVIIEKNEVIENVNEKIYYISEVVSKLGISTDSKSAIVLKYIPGRGKIKYGFEIRVDNSDGECCVGRDTRGKEYLQYDTRVSNEHLFVIYKKQKWLINDKRSTNGTMLNKKLLEKGKEYEVKNGDVIVLGTKDDSLQLKVVIDADC